MDLYPEEKAVKWWYMSFTPDGKLWCGASNPKEVYERSKDHNCTYRVSVLYQRTVVEDWVPYASAG